MITTDEELTYHSSVLLLCYSNGVRVARCRCLANRFGCVRGGDCRRVWSVGIDQGTQMTTVYLSLTEVAALLGVTTGGLASQRLPEPDVVIGKTRGWSPNTIQEWLGSRPGKGVGGGRPKKPPQP